MNNLIDNAIKYSENNSKIIIATSNEVDEYIKVIVGITVLVFLQRI